MTALEMCHWRTPQYEVIGRGTCQAEIPPVSIGTARWANEASQRTEGPLIRRRYTGLPGCRLRRRWHRSHKKCAPGTPSASCPTSGHAPCTATTAGMSTFLSSAVVVRCLLAIPCVPRPDCASPQLDRGAKTGLPEDITEREHMSQDTCQAEHSASPRERCDSVT